MESSSPLFKLKVGITEESPMFRSPLKNRLGLTGPSTVNEEKIKGIMDPGWHNTDGADPRYRKGKSKTIEKYMK